MTRFVKERRPTISPNFNFLGQLYEYEKIQQNELLKQNSEAESLQCSISTSSSTIQSNAVTASAATSLPFLKFTKKQQSAVNLFETQSIESSLAKSQRKKQYVFQFNNPIDPSVNENILSPQLAQPAKPSLLLNSIVGQSIHNSLIPSPSQAFSNFNLNSPSTTQTSKAIINAFESYSKLDFTQTNMTKSFTINDIHDYTGDKVVMRRPTNLQMPLSNDKNVNNLKRPSSILLDTNNNNNITSNEAKATEFLNYNFAKPTAANSSPFMTSNKLFNNALNSASSASSSCSSSASSSSASSTLMSSLMNSNFANNQQQCLQHQHQKKIKLSPIQDRNILSNFNQSSVCLLLFIKIGYMWN